MNTDGRALAHTTLTELCRRSVAVVQAWEEGRRYRGSAGSNPCTVFLRRELVGTVGHGFARRGDVFARASGRVARSKQRRDGNQGEKDEDDRKGPEHRDGPWLESGGSDWRPKRLQRHARQCRDSFRRLDGAVATLIYPPGETANCNDNHDGGNQKQY